MTQPAFTRPADPRATMLDRLCDALGLAPGSSTAAIRRKYSAADDPTRGAVAVAMRFSPSLTPEALDASVAAMLANYDSLPAPVREKLAASRLTKEQRQIIRELNCTAVDFVTAKAERA